MGDMDNALPKRVSIAHRVQSVTKGRGDMDKQQRQKLQSFLANRFLVSKSETRRRLRADGLTKEQVDNIMKPITPKGEEIRYE